MCRCLGAGARVMLLRFRRGDSYDTHSSCTCMRIDLDDFTYFSIRNKGLSERPKHILNCAGDPRSVRLTAHPPYYHHHNAARSTPRAGLPGNNTMRTRRVVQHIHINPQRDPEGLVACREQAHGLVSARMVLSHGGYRWDREDMEEGATRADRKQKSRS
jgi:hypothetical protein